LLEEDRRRLKEEDASLNSKGLNEIAICEEENRFGYFNVNEVYKHVCCENDEYFYCERLTVCGCRSLQ
jgi:hypothetical protein